MDDVSLNHRTWASPGEGQDPGILNLFVLWPNILSTMSIVNFKKSCPSHLKMSVDAHGIVRRREKYSAVVNGVHHILV